jgi:hypothetical protein
VAVLLLLLQPVVAGVLREHGHKTPLAWILSGILMLILLAVRFWRLRRR